MNLLTQMPRLTKLSRTTSPRNFCQPPRRFKAANNVTRAYLTTEPSFIRKLGSKASRAQRNGLRYERRVFTRLQQEFPERSISGMWLAFESSERTNLSYCQPDALIFDFERGRIGVIEAKLKHTSDSWWQLRRLYIPVLQSLFCQDDSLWEFVPIEVCHYFDPDTRFPERFHSLVDLSDFATIDPEKFYVHIWGGRVGRR